MAFGIGTPLGSVIEPPMVAVFAKLDESSPSTEDFVVVRLAPRLPPMANTFEHSVITATAAAVVRRVTRRRMERKPTGQSRDITVPSARRCILMQRRPSVEAINLTAARRLIREMSYTWRLHERQKRTRSLPLISSQFAGHGTRDANGNGFDCVYLAPSCWLPMRCAGRSDPTKARRYE